MQTGYLILEDGKVFEGKMPVWQQHLTFQGEVVFTTGMCGYTESLTDPSFAGQILVFTYPSIGNYGVTSSALWESTKMHVAGVIVNESCDNWSHHAGLCSLREWLQKENIPLLTEVDTRELTKIIRSSGTLRGVIASESTTRLCHSSSPHLVKTVSTKEKILYGKGIKRVIAVDCGMKESMVRSLASYPIEVLRVPHDYDYSEEAFDGVFLSNGPGDPTDCVQTIAVLKKAMQKKKPIFGVCLGSQLLALASGAQTYKLTFGHRGQNQPCIDVETKKCYITSQNHGYAVDEKTLSPDWKVTFRNLNDGSVEGIAHIQLPFYSVQFHPEASPGPTDTKWFFERFWTCLQS